MAHDENGADVERHADVELDARGLNCPMPLLKAKQALNRMQRGQRLHVVATDPGSLRDFEVFCQQSGHVLERQREDESPGSGPEFHHWLTCR